ncbi:MAG: TatD family hydrolase [Akkermansia sp.]|nr:TatD family hydrolase [Akkermansia sp.]
MRDYHTHHPNPSGGYICSVTRADWPRVAEADGMTPCFGVHPWHAHEVDVAELAFELDDWLVRNPGADVGETGLDASDRHRETLEQQRLLLHVHLGAAFRHDRCVHLHGVHAWAELLSILQERARCNTLPRIHLHAWNGSHELARQFLALGATFSVGLRELTHSRAEERYARIPEGRLFPESDDSPANWPRTLALFRLLRQGL